ncbi:MAG: sodium:proton antiporter [Bacteroidales bacterium]|nr:sodium:proton antiporter [Bacteroidales bacterium]
MGNKRISASVSLIPLLVLVGLLFAVVRFFRADALDGGSQVALLLASGVVIAIAMLGFKVPWSSLEGAIADNIKSIGTAIIVLLLIGAVAGTWMVSGIVPTLIYYGLKVLSPKFFLLAVCLICALVSLMTGSSWTTVATIGTAFIGIGMALGFSPGWTAGAIISGAYFGDKISPLSDTTVLASSVTETPLFTHIRYMLITTIPSISIACIIFLIASLVHKGGSPVMAADFCQALKSSYNISGWLLLVPVITGILIARRLPAMITLSIAAALAAVTALIAQPDIIDAIGGGNSFKGVFISIYGNTSIETGYDALDTLVQTKGMNGMMSTIFLIFCAAAFGGALNGSGMIQSLTDALTRHIKGRTSLVASTVATGIFSNLVAGDQYLSIILTTSLYKKLFEDKGYESRLLSRSAEDSATVTSVLIPWNSCGMTQSTVLKVPTLEYLPYCFFNLISPLMSILIAAAGYKIARRKMVP